MIDFLQNAALGLFGLVCLLSVLAVPFAVIIFLSAAINNWENKVNVITGIKSCVKCESRKFDKITQVGKVSLLLCRDCGTYCKRKGSFTTGWKHKFYKEYPELLDD